MRIVVADQSLAWLGGAETYALTVAEHLQRLGHDVVVATMQLGIAAEIARSRGLRVTLVEDLDPGGAVALTQDAVVAYELADRYPEWPQVHIVHSDIFDTHLPPALAQTRAVVTLYDRVDARVRAMDLDCRVVRLAQPVDVERFKPTGPLRRERPVVLALGNYLQGPRSGVVRQACAEAGLELLQVGAQDGGFTKTPEDRINEADIVIGKARVILEAMACGRAAYVFDHNGGEGWVTANNASNLGADNFGGQREPVVLDLGRLTDDLRAYDSRSGQTNRDYVVAHHAAGAHAAALVDILREVTGGGGAGRRGSSFELARMTRMFHGADAERFHLRTLLERHSVERDEALEVAQRERECRLAVEERVRELDTHLAVAHDRVAVLDGAREDDEAAFESLQREYSELVESRRWRTLRRLLSPLDRLRRRG